MIHNAIVKDGGIFIPNFDLNDPKVTGELFSQKGVKVEKNDFPFQEFQLKIRVLEESKLQETVATPNSKVATKTEAKKPSLAGVFSQYANPALIEKEKEAWAMAMVEKHENR